MTQTDRGLDPTYHREESIRWRQVLTMALAAIPPHPPLPTTRIGWFVDWLRSLVGGGIRAQEQRIVAARTQIASNLYRHFVADRGHAILAGEIPGAAEWFAEGLQHSIQARRAQLSVPTGLTDPDIAGAVLIATILGLVRNPADVAAAGVRIAERVEATPETSTRSLRLVSRDGGQ